MILSLMISHVPGIHHFTDTRFFIPGRERSEMYEFLESEAQYILSLLLENALKKALTEI